MSAPRKKPVPQPTLKAWRDFRDLTLEQVGNIVGKSAQAIHKWEAGKVPVTLDNLGLLAKAYRTEPTRLLSMPDEGGLEERYRRAHSVLSSLDGDRAVRWLEMGEDLASMLSAERALAVSEKN